MSQDELVELDGDALALLAMYRNEERPAEGVKDRVWERMESEPAAPVARIDRPSSASTMRWVGVGMAAAAALVLAFVGLQGWTVTEDPGGAPQRPEAALQHETVESGGMAQDKEPPRQAQRRVPATVVEDQPEPQVEPETEPEAASELETEVDTSSPRPKTKRRPEPTEPATVETLAAETGLLKRARAALAGGNADGCLSLLSEHAKRFPTGVLAEERDALKAVALCSSGRKADGRRAAAKFSKRHPTSPLRARVSSACADEKNP